VLADSWTRVCHYATAAATWDTLFVGALDPVPTMDEPIVSRPA
jgi:hypothetical protein